MPGPVSLDLRKQPWKQFVVGAAYLCAPPFHPVLNLFLRMLEGFEERGIKPLDVASEAGEEACHVLLHLCEAFRPSLGKHQRGDFAAEVFLAKPNVLDAQPVLFQQSLGAVVHQGESGSRGKHRLGSFECLV